jgi:hypothetical protein
MVRNPELVAAALAGIFAGPFVVGLIKRRYVWSFLSGVGLIAAKTALDFFSKGDHFSFFSDIGFNTLVCGGSFVFIAILVVFSQRWREREEPGKGKCVGLSFLHLGN